MAAAVGRMVDALAHRGPDDAGVWCDPRAGIALGNRRLAIVDTSDAGHQPMRSPSGRYAIVLNGEIYNHPDLRVRLVDEGRAPAWHGHSDTETLAACIDAWGLARTLDAVIGMFGLAVWDAVERRLTLARDRTGEKPLYYGRFDDLWLFGSELKALLAHPACERRIDPHAFESYMALGYIPAPLSIHRGIHKLRPGCTVVLDASGREPAVSRYWSALERAADTPLSFDGDEDAVDAAEALLSDAVAKQLLSDRPLGALLSGGIDSTLMVALMSVHAPERVRTFSIGFHERSFNEAEFASHIARHFRTAHTELYLTGLDVIETIDRLPAMFDEPFADMSSIPTHLISQVASRSVTVAIAGDGGDELFGGYPRYGMGTRLWPMVQRVPRALRPALGRLLHGLSYAGIDRAFAWAFPHDDVTGVRGLRPAQKMSKLARALRSRDADELYWQLLAPWSEPSLTGTLRQRAQGVGGDGQPVLRAALRYPVDDVGDRETIAEAFMLHDLVGYLPDDILTKVDRASMAASLESRAPMLDHRVVDFALRLPMRYKRRDREGKWILRRVLDRHIPRDLMDRPKMGFTIPSAAWLRGPLKSWAYDLVLSAAAPGSELIARPALLRMLERHSRGLGDWSQPLWTALMFLAWTRHAASVAPRRSVTDATAHGGVETRVEVLA